MDGVTLPVPATSLPLDWWVHGQTPRERKADKPAWADFVEHAVTTPLPGRPPVGDWRVEFAGVFRSFVDAASREAVPEHLAGADVDALRAGFAAQLDQHLLKLSVRTLVLELHRARKGDALQGETSEERFADFVRQQSTAAGLVRLFSEYPVLARLVAQACRHAAEAHAEMLTRYLRMIQVQRGDFNGRMLTVRRDDLRAIACLLDVNPDAARAKLEELGLRFTPS